MRVLIETAGRAVVFGFEPENSVDDASPDNLRSLLARALADVPGDPAPSSTTITKEPASLTPSGCVTVLAVEAIKRGQQALDYYIKDQGWTEDYARDHAEVVFSSTQ